jgi:hypothetical protein
MYISARLLGSIATRKMDKEVDTIEVDWNKFFYNILFADHFILDSVRLREVPFLVRQFGYLEVRNLLLTKSLSIRCDTYNLGFRIENPTHRFHYPVFGIDVPDRNQYIQGCLNENGFQDGLEGYIHKGEKIELLNLIQEKLLPPPKEPLKPIYEAFSREVIQNHQYLKLLIQQQVYSVTGKEPRTEAIDLEVKIIEPEIYKIKNNLSSLGLNKDVAHKLIGNCISLLSNKHHRLFKANYDEAIGCYNEQEQHILEDSFRYLARQLNVENHIRSFERVIEIACLPGLANIDTLRISKLLEIRNSSEWVSFRKWISEISDWSSQDIQKELQHKSSRLVALAGGTTGKAIGRIINFGALFLEAAPAALIEVFPWLVRKITSPKGHVVFLYRDYPSIFK